MPRGPTPTGTTLPAENAPVPLPFSTETLFEPAFVTIRSVLASPFTSRSATPEGSLPTGIVPRLAKRMPDDVAAVRNVDTVLLPAFATKISGTTSPVTSPTASAEGRDP